MEYPFCLFKKLQDNKLKRKILNMLQHGLSALTKDTPDVAYFNEKKKRFKIQLELKQRDT